VITVELAEPDEAGIKEIIEDLYVFYRPEGTPPAE
jgi:hypothetical protein